MTRHRKRDRTNKNTMELCEDRSDESDSYGDDGSDSEVEYGLVSHKIDLLSLSRQLFEAEHDETFEYDAEDEYDKPYLDMVSFRESEDGQSFKFGDGNVLGDILEASVPPPMQFRNEVLGLSIPPLPDLCCSETDDSFLDCNDEPFELQTDYLVTCPPPGFVSDTPWHEGFVTCPPSGFVNEAPQNKDLAICSPPGFISDTPWNEGFIICSPSGFVSEVPGLMDENAHLSGVTGLEVKKMDRTSDVVKKNVENFDNIALRVSIVGVKMWVEIDSCSSKTMMDELAFRKILENQKMTLNKPNKP